VYVQVRAWRGRHGGHGDKKVVVWERRACNQPPNCFFSHTPAARALRPSPPLRDNSQCIGNWHFTRLTRHAHIPMPPTFTPRSAHPTNPPAARTRRPCRKSSTAPACRGTSKVAASPRKSARRWRGWLRVCED
jgi:hypothetical protein